MSRDELREALRPHARRPIRAFWRAPDPGNHQDTRVFDAFIELVYDGTPNVNHAQVRALNAELAQSTRTVGELLGGWRPTALKEVP